MFIFVVAISLDITLFGNGSIKEIEMFESDTKGTYLSGIYYAAKQQYTPAELASASEKGSFVIQSGCTMELGNDAVISGLEAYYGGAIFIENGATLTIKAGAQITGNASRLGGAIYVSRGGRLNIEAFEDVERGYTQITGNYSEPMQGWMLDQQSIKAEGKAAAIYAEDGALIYYKDSEEEGAEWINAESITDETAFENIIKDNIAQCYGNYVFCDIGGTKSYLPIGLKETNQVNSIQLNFSQTGWTEQEQQRGFKVSGNTVYIKPNISYKECPGYFTSDKYYIEVTDENSDQYKISSSITYKTVSNKTFKVYGMQGEGTFEGLLFREDNTTENENFFGIKGEISENGYYTKQATNDKIKFSTGSGSYYAEIKKDSTGEIVIPKQNSSGKNITYLKVVPTDAKQNVESVFMPNTIKTIANDAFLGCTGLKEIIIGDGVTSIGTNAFSGCTSLDKVVYKAKNVSKSYTGKAFEPVSIAIEEITDTTDIDEYGLKINYNAQTNPFCTKKTTSGSTSKKQYQFIYDKNNNISKEKYGEATITDNNQKKMKVTFVGVQSLPVHLFEYCYSLKEVDFIGCEDLSVSSYCFDGCVNLTTVRGYDINENEITDFVKRFNYRSFAECRRLTQMGSVANKITIPSMAEASKIYKPFEDVFHGCASIVNVEFPRDLTEIGSMAFRGCNNLKSVTFRGNGKNALKTIGGSAFYHTDIYFSFTIPDSVETIGSYCFAECEKLQYVNFPKNENFTHLADGIFQNSGLRRITIPETITSIGSEILYNCKYLEVLNYKGNVPNNYDVGISYFGNPGSMAENMTIKVEDNVTLVPAYMFRNMTYVKNVIIGKNVKYIYTDAFVCSGGNKSRVENLWFYAADCVTGKFGDGFGAQDWVCTIGENVTKIKSEFCSGNKNLKTLVIEGNVTEIGQSAFRNCISLDTIEAQTYSYFNYDWCSELHEREFVAGLAHLEGYNKNVVLKYDDCNPIGMVAGEFGDISELSVHEVSKEIDYTMLDDINILSERFATFMEDLDVPAHEDESGEIIETTISDTSVIKSFESFYNKAREIYNCSQFPNEINSIPGEYYSAIIGLNCDFEFICRGSGYSLKGNGGYYNHAGDIAELFGFRTRDDYEDYFLVYIQELADIYSQHRANKEAGLVTNEALDNNCFYTNNGSFVFPIVFKTDEPEIIFSFVIIDSNNSVYIWVNASRYLSTAYIVRGMPTLTAELYCKNRLFPTSDSFLPSLEIIESYAFSGCTNFGCNIITNNTKYIGDYAFSGCHGFTGDLVIYKNISYIGQYAFADCGTFDEIRLYKNIYGTESYCSEEKSRSINYGGNIINVTYDDCNPFGMVAGDFGSIDNLNKHTDHTAKSSVISKFDELGELFEAYKNSNQSLFISEGDSCAEVSEAYLAFYNKALEIYDTESLIPFVREPDLLGFTDTSQNPTRSIIVGLNKLTSIIYNENDSLGGLQTFVARQFGFYSGQEFMNYAQQLVNIYSQYRANKMAGLEINEALENGCFFTSNGLFIFPIVFDQEEYISKTTRHHLNFSYLIIDNDDVWFWRNSRTEYSIGLDKRLYCKNTLFVDGIYQEGIFDCVHSEEFTLCNNMTIIPDRFLKNADINTFNFNAFVETIGNNAFENSSLTGDFIMPNTVKNVEAKAFYNCASLNGAMIISENVSEIKYQTFARSAITAISIPNSVTGMDSDSLYFCNKLTEIYYNANIETFKNNDSPFTNSRYDDRCVGSEDGFTFIIGDDVTKLPSYILSDNPRLKSLIVGKNVAAGVGATIYHPMLESVWVDPDNETYDSRNDCNAVIITESKTLAIGCINTVIPDNVVIIGGSAFKDTKIENIVLPDGVTAIRSSAFEGCELLKSINIPDGVTSIGNYAFMDCESLQNITIPGSVKGIGYLSFSHCYELENLIIQEGENDLKISEQAFYYCESLFSVSLPGNLKQIGNNSFVGCSNIFEIVNNSSISILAGVSDSKNGNISKYASVVVKNKGEFVTDGGITYYKNATAISDDCPNGIYTPVGKFLDSSITSLTISSECKRIEQNSLKGCSKLKNVTIPYGVKSIGIGAFTGCSSLQSINIPSSVKSIGGSAFSYCSALQSIDIPSSVSFIWEYTFYKCVSLQNVKLPNNLLEIREYAFAECSSLQKITIPGSVFGDDGIGKYAFLNCTSLNEVTFASGSKAKDLRLSGWGTFEGCSSLKSITIPDRVKYIHQWTFKNSGLESVTVNARIITIDAFAFCENLKYVTIGASVKEIGRHLFGGESNGGLSKNVISVTFLKTDGWYITTESDATSGEAIDVTNPQTNASNLKDTYISYYWKRNAS